VRRIGKGKVPHGPVKEGKMAIEGRQPRGIADPPMAN